MFSTNSARRYSQVKVHPWYQQHQCASGVNYIGGKFAAVINNTGGKFAEVGGPQISFANSKSVNLRAYKFFTFANLPQMWHLWI
jgi:hypothetical protein